MPTRLKNIIAKRKLLISATIVVAGVILVVLLGAGRSNKPAQATPRPVEVKVSQVAHQDVPVYSEWIGTTDGMVNADIKAQVTGDLLLQDYKEGSFVNKGQLLFEIDPRPFQAALDQANGQVAQFRGQLEQADSQVGQAHRVAANQQPVPPPDRSVMQAQMS